MSAGSATPVRISACIITKDEERDLPECLASVAFCDEIVVVDSGSADATVEIATTAGARVVHQDWLGFAAQRNVALDHARGDWVLEIDADERVTGPLRAEIEAFLAAPPDGVDLGGIPRREVLVGHPLGASAKFPNYCHRLLRRGTLRHDERRTVHEGLVPEGPVHPFGGELRHLFAPTWRDAISDARRYGALEAGQMSAPRTPSAVLKGAVVRPCAKFAFRLAVDGGWRDGALGAAKIALDCATDASVWLRYARRGATGAGSSGVTGDAHYGARRFPRGSAHVAVVAVGADAARAGAAWAAQAAGAGLDVALLTDASTQGPPVAGVRRRRVAGRGPLATIRALDAEEQLRTIDAVVAVGGRARAWVRAAPGRIAGIVAPASPSTGPAELAERVAEARRELGA